MFSIGFDPGLTAPALTLLNADHSIARCYDLKILEVKARGKIRKSVCWPSILRLSRTLASLEPEHVVVEMVGGIPNQSAPAAFNFGYAAAVPAYALFAAGIPLERFIFVAPSVWVGRMGCRAPGNLNSAEKKEFHRQHASKLYPNHADKWPLKKHAGRAESFMLADYGFKNAHTG